MCGGGGGGNDGGAKTAAHLRHSNRLSRPRARSVELNARPAGTNKLRNLRRSRDEHFEEKLAIKRRGLRCIDGCLDPGIRRCADNSSSLTQVLVEQPIATSRDELRVEERFERRGNRKLARHFHPRDDARIDAVLSNEVKRAEGRGDAEAILWAAERYVRYCLRSVRAHRHRAAPWVSRED